MWQITEILKQSTSTSSCLLKYTAWVNALNYILLVHMNVQPAEVSLS